MGLCTLQLTDTDILNFALNLEYLEAEYYSWAVHGRGIATEFRGGKGITTGGAKATLTGPILVQLLPVQCQYQPTILKM